MTLAVSVVIPAFNRQGTIGRAIRSVLAQSHPIGEILVVDDSSTDQTAIAATSAAHATVRVIRRGSRGGACVARNDGIEQAYGDVVAFLDADDAWTPHYVREQLASLRGASAAVCGLRADYGGRRRSAMPTRLNHDARAALLANRHGSFSSSCIVLDRRVIASGVRFDDSFDALQDLDLLLQVASVGRIEITRKYLVNKFANSPGRVHSGRNIVAGREALIAKWGHELVQDPGSLGRQHRLLVLAAARHGTNEDVEGALASLSSLGPRERGLKGQLLLVAAHKGRDTLARAASGLNRAENLSPASLVRRGLDVYDDVIGSRFGRSGLT